MERSPFLACAALALLACSDPSSETKEHARVASTRGGAIATSRDGSIAVGANRTAGVVSVFRLDPKRAPDELVQSVVEVDGIDPASEPWSAVLGSDDDTAYVVLRKSQELVKIRDLHGTPRVEASLAVGSEPTAIAITPLGGTIFVANWGEGTISVVATVDFQAYEKVDLNGALVQTGALGDLTPRPGLAHPRALAVTDDGDTDDGDETLYATEFYSQPLDADAPDDDTEFDRNRQGLVYAVSMQGHLLPTISLSPFADTGFMDAESRTTSCFPNQLYAAATHGPWLLVTSMCTSPRGPLGPSEANVKTGVHPAIFAIDTRTNSESYRNAILLSQAIVAEHDPASGEPLRLPLIPNDIVTTGPEPNSDVFRAYVTAFGADAVFRIDYAEAHPPEMSGWAEGRFIDLHSGPSGGMLPIGISSPVGGSALVLNDNTQNLSVVDLERGVVAAAHDVAPNSESARTKLDSAENRGRRFFATGLEVWSFGGQAWSSCESCHPDGLSDGVTWFFPRGPRRTISTAGTYVNGSQRLMLWTASIDEIHDIEVIVRSVSGGAGGVLWSYAGKPDATCRIVYDGAEPLPRAETGCELQKHTTTLRNGLNGTLAEIVTGKPPTCALDGETCDNSPFRDWNDIDAFIRSVRSPRRPTNLVEEWVTAGAAAFEEGGCAGCHSGDHWTLSRRFYTPDREHNGDLPYANPGAVALDYGWLRSTRYLVPEALRGLNVPGASGSATLRTFSPADATDLAAVTYAYDAATKTTDQINCVLRSVGTFPDQTSGANTLGIVPTDAPPVLEVRQDMQTLAMGQTGFNVPSLLGLSLGAPYLHAGNARTLEEVFDRMFEAHYGALAPGFLSNALSRADQIDALVAYLLSIDDDTVPAVLPSPELDLCAQVE